MKKFFLTSPVLLLLTSSIALGAEYDFNLFKGQGIGAATNILNRLINWMYTILLIMVVIFILLAAFEYLTSAGKEEKLTKGKHMLIYAAVALVIAFSAQGFRFIIENLAGVNSSSTDDTYYDPTLDPSNPAYWDDRQQSPPDGPLEVE